MSKILIETATVKLALDALVSCEMSNYGRKWVWPVTAHEQAMKNVRSAITAIKEALAAQVEVCCGDYGKCMKPCTPRGKWLAEQPAQQEPLLQDIEQYRMQMAGICTAAIGYWKEGDGIHPDYDTLALQDVAKLYAKYDELYRAQPAQRTWVGLTDAEVEDFVSALWPVGAGAGKLLQAIEAKLKEKNNG